MSVNVNTNTNNTVSTSTVTNATTQTPVKRGPGRPKGSKNKPKVAATQTVANTTSDSSDDLTNN